MPFTIDPQFTEETLIDLVQIPSENPPGSNRDIVQYLVELAEREKLAVKRQYVDNEREMENVLIAPSKEGFRGRKIVLVGHLDTVPVGEAWTKDPFGKDQDGDILYGRGACDMKSGVAAFLSVIKAFKLIDPQPITPVFIGTADEEDLMRGAKSILNLEDFRTRPDFAVIGEPTGLHVGVAEKGISHIRVTAKGVAAHGARPDLGANAIDACYHIIQAIREDLPATPDPLLGAPTLNLGMLNGGIKVNVVADRCSAELDFRFGPSYGPESMEKLVQEACMKIERPCKGYYNVIHQLPALGTSPSHSLIQVVSKELAKLGHEPEVIGLTYATDGAVLIPEWKIPFLIFGPGDRKALHISDEWVSIQETVTAAQAICNTIMTLNSRV